MFVVELQLCSMFTFAITLGLLYINMIYRATDISSFKFAPPNYFLGRCECQWMTEFH